MMAKRGLSNWECPVNEDTSKLYLFNSLTRRKEIFVPQFGNKVFWYSCGPTVYDASHMGHARSYISFDIMRRILQDYFKYDVVYCMNITDIDDKIIKRARQNKLFDDYVANERGLPEVLEDVNCAMLSFNEKLDKEKDPAKKQMLSTTLNNMESARELLNEKINGGSSIGDVKISKKQLLDRMRDPLSEWLDHKFGASLTDNSIFFDLPRHWENEYHKDMALLNVLPPDILTRVTEFVPEIVEFVQKIIDNGFAYEANGSVYFDTARFSQDDKHYYAKLVPEAYGDSQALQEGEGDLILTSDRLSEKKSSNDFALWKFSKPGEPKWESPWGNGRPGWHIECSVMASRTLGDSIDIHTGGCDLKFPHHDNELAQAEAHYGHSHWIRYFLHSGHLNIDGLKMSKSLKNFTSIKDALKKHSATQIRLAFLLHSWKDTLDYSSETMEIALAFEKKFNEFFLNVKSVLRHLPNSGAEMFRKWTKAEETLNHQFCEGKAAVHKCLCDSLDTRGAMEQMKEIISASNRYMRDCQTSKQMCDYILLKNVAGYLTDMLKVFGAIGKDSAIGFSKGASQSVNLEETAMPYLDCLAEFRTHVRENAALKKDSEALKLCDSLRDDKLPNLGVRFEDTDDGPTVIKMVDKDTLIKEREEKLKVKELEAIEKANRKAKAEADKLARETASRVHPSEMFTKQSDKYSKFDDKGMPTHTADGKEVSKSQLKKLLKLYDMQMKKIATS